MLRKIIRRAIRHGRLLGQTQPFLYKMVEAVVKEMIGAYPELGDSAARVAKVIESEEIRFANTVAVGLSKLQDLLDHAANNTLPGSEAFKLYDTFGLPLDFMIDAARDQGVDLRSGRLRRRHGGAAHHRPRQLEGRLAEVRVSGLRRAAADHL